MKRLVAIVLLTCLVSFCCHEDDVVVAPVAIPDNALAGTTPFNPATRAALEGVYRVVEGGEAFGEYVVLKWSGVATGTDTSFILSGFFGRDAAYVAAKGGMRDGVLLFSGTWRKLMNTDAGMLQATVADTNGAPLLRSPSGPISKDSVTITGSWGSGEGAPNQSIVLRYDRPLYKGKRFDIIAHRGGGRTSDLLPVSENSVEMILFTERLGSTAIEIDVRPTRDMVPVLYHDATLNLRLTQKSGLTGEIEEYTYEQLQTLVRLLHGERIPTLREALDAALYRTSLRLIYLDTKPTMPLDLLRQIQQEYIAKAAAAGRQLELLIGLPSEEKVNEFEKLPGYTQIPSLCELEVDVVRRVNARAWSPRWTMGAQEDLVTQMHAEGRRAFAWTLDLPQYIEQFIAKGYDGLITNYTPTVAYYHYIRQGE